MSGKPVSDHLKNIDEIVTALQGALLDAADAVDEAGFSERLAERLSSWSVVIDHLAVDARRVAGSLAAQGR